MRNSARSVLRWPLGCLAVWLLLPLTAVAEPAAAPPCLEGSSPAAFVRLAVFESPGDISAGATVELDRVILAAGEELQPETAGYTAFYVESGTLKFLVPPRGGFHLEHPAHCETIDGVYSGGGTESVDDDGWMRVEAGSALVSDEVPIERIGNAGSTPLELLQVTLILPELDSVTGQASSDGLETDRGKRERKNERRDRRDATPTP